MNPLIRKSTGVLALLAALLLLAAGWSFRPVSAQLTETKTVTTSFSPSPAGNGQEVTLTVDVDGWFGGAQFIIDYDRRQTQLCGRQCPLQCRSYGE